MVNLFFLLLLSNTINTPWLGSNTRISLLLSGKHHQPPVFSHASETYKNTNKQSSQSHLFNSDVDVTQLRNVLWILWVLKQVCLRLPLFVLLAVQASVHLGAGSIHSAEPCRHRAVQLGTEGGVQGVKVLCCDSCNDAVLIRRFWKVTANRNVINNDDDSVFFFSVSFLPSTSLWCFYSEQRASVHQNTYHSLAQTLLHNSCVYTWLFHVLIIHIMIRWQCLI